MLGLLIDAIPEILRNDRDQFEKAYKPLFCGYFMLHMIEILIM